MIGSQQRKTMQIHPARIKARAFLHRALSNYKGGDPKGFRDMPQASHKKKRVGAYGRKLWRQEVVMLLDEEFDPACVPQTMLPEQVMASARLWSLERGLISPILFLESGIYPEQLKEIWGMRPYKYVVLATPRSMSYWLADFLGFDHDASADWSAGKWKPKSEGVVDTGLALMPESCKQAMIHPGAEILGLTRGFEESVRSMIGTFGLEEEKAKEIYLACHEAISKFSPQAIVNAPLDVTAARLFLRSFCLQYRNREYIEERLSVRKDRASEPGYIDTCKAALQKIK